MQQVSLVSIGATLPLLKNLKKKKSQHISNRLLDKSRSQSSEPSSFFQKLSKLECYLVLAEGMLLV